MKVQIWSDFVCPFCYIGKRHLTQAIEELGIEVEIELMSYELDPHYVDQPDLDIHETLANKHGTTVQKSRESNEYSAKMAEEVGLVYNHDTMKYSNTFNAHKLFQRAKELNKGNEFAELLMHGFFTEGENLNDEKTLISFAKKVGINEKEVKDILQDDSYSLKVRQDEQWARTINAKGAPHFVINDKVSVSGAQGATVLKEAMEYVLSLEETPVEFGSSDGSGMICDDESCEVK